MAAIETSHAVNGIFGQTLTRVTTAIASYFEVRSTRKALSQLSDRELDDIGLTRSDIEQIGLHH